MKRLHATLITSLLIVAAGCAGEPAGQPKLLSAGAAPQDKGAAPAKGKAQLWAQHCVRCHNIRPADSYSDNEWDTVMLHMRIRANLGGDDARSIAEFLKAAN